MLSRKNLFAVCCVLSLLLAAMIFSGPRHALGQMTIPTRTPVPDGQPPEPDPEPVPTDDNGGGNKPQPTNEPDPGPQPTDDPQPLPPSPVPSLPPATAVPTLTIATETPVSTEAATATRLIPTETPSAATATATSAVSPTAASTLPVEAAVAFPEDDQPFPQANPCGMPPTFTTLEAITVYAGPGEDYQLVGLIGAEGVRPIVGRAAFTTWWVVQLDRSGRAGWVNNQAGIVHGYTGRVPIVSAPDLNGIAPTPGAAWVPTPDANCNAPELLAGVVVDQARGSGSEVPPSGKPDSLEGLPELGENVQASPDEQNTQGEEGAPPLIQTAGKSAEIVVESALAMREEAANPLLAELADTAPPLELPTASAPQLPNLMPVAGLILIIAAIFIGLIAKKNRSGLNE